MSSVEESNNDVDYLESDDFDFDSMAQSSVLESPSVDLTDDYRRFVMDHKLRLHLQSNFDGNNENNLGENGQEDQNTTMSRIFYASCDSSSVNEATKVISKQCCTYSDVAWPTVASPCGKHVMWAPFITLQIVGGGDGGQGSIGFTASSINEMRKDRFIRVLSPPKSSSSHGSSSGSCSSRFSILHTSATSDQSTATVSTTSSPDTSSPDIIVMAKGGRGGRGGSSKTHHRIRCPMKIDSYPNHNPSLANKLLSLTVVVGVGGRAGRNLYVNRENELLHGKVAPFKHDNGTQGFSSHVIVKCPGRLSKVFTCSNDDVNTNNNGNNETQDAIVITKSSTDGALVQFPDVVFESFHGNDTPPTSPKIKRCGKAAIVIASPSPLKLPLHFNLTSMRSMQDCEGRYLASSSAGSRSSKSASGRKIQHNDCLSGTVGGIMIGPILWHAHPNTKHSHELGECHLSYPFPTTPFSISNSWDCCSTAPSPSSSLIPPQILSHPNGDVIHTWRSVEKEIVAQMNGIVAYGGCGGCSPYGNYDNDDEFASPCNIGMGGHGGCVPMLDPSSSLPIILPHDSFDNDTLDLKKDEYLRYEPSPGSEGIVIISWSKS